MEPEEIFTIEGCLNPWVELVLLYNSSTKSFTASPVKEEYQKLYQTLEKSILEYTKGQIKDKARIRFPLIPKIKEIDINLDATLAHLKATERNDFSIEEVACLLLYNSRFVNKDLDANVLVRGCFQHISINRSTRKKRRTTDEKDYLTLVQSILEDKENLELFSVIANSNRAQISKNKLEEKFLEMKIVEDEPNTMQIYKVCLYSCPAEQFKKAINLNIFRIVDMIGIGSIVTKISPLELNLENRFRSNNLSKKTAIYDSDEEDLKDLKDLFFLFQNDFKYAYEKLFSTEIFEEMEIKAIDYLTLVPLPCARFNGIWESLRMNKELKERMYSNASTSLMLSMNHPIENTGNLMLLFGLPGTGKSSLAKALFQKLSIKIRSLAREKNNSPPVLLLELRAEKIFSRYFGESPKKLDAIFTFIESLLDSQIYLFMIIDEVESIAIDRSKLFENNETADSIRLVNTLLKHLDNLKKFKTFFLITTSNIVSSIDSAFKDRATGIFNFQLPNQEEVRMILQDEFTKLSAIGLLTEAPVCSPIIQKIAKFCTNKQMSGRSIRRLPKIALNTIIEDEQAYLDIDTPIQIPICELIVEIAYIIKNYHDI